MDRASLRSPSRELLLLVMLFSSACASTRMLQRSDYKPIREMLVDSAPQQGVEHFPTLEPGGLISTSEKTYLGLLAGQPNPEPLMHVADHLAEREVTYISRELSDFFYQESEEGYFPAEHEIVWLHILTGLSFAAKGQRDDARVEAVRAAHFLQGHYNEKTGDFDDPGLRTMLAGLFLYCDEWEHARVDLRRAAELSDHFKWAGALAERAQAPQQLILVLGGVGPEPVWDPDSAKKYVTGLGSLRFDGNDTLSAVEITDASEAHVARLSASHETKPWYDRHQRRNSEIRETLQTSKYMMKASGVSAATGTGMLLSKVASGTLLVGGIALAAGIIGGTLYLAAQAGGGSGEGIAYLLGLGLAVGQYATGEALSFDRKNMRELTSFWKSNMDASANYRYVRFLPDRIFAMGYAHEEFLNARVRKANGGLLAPFLSLSSQSGKSNVSLFFVPK